MASPVISVEEVVLKRVVCEGCGIVGDCYHHDEAQELKAQHYRVYHMPAKIESTEEVDEDSGD